MRFLTILFLICAAPQIFAQLAPPREFRAAWVATVANIDFPTRKNLSVADQKAEIIKIVETAEKLKLNCLIFQIRPQADALYNSKLEPWSEFLTGQAGKPPAPFYDPLEFFVQESHRRGILVHAWLNPYRASHPSAKTVSPKHISQTRPDLVRKYGNYLWLDPSEPDVQTHSLAVVADVVRRYDVDGIHFDDYFYPYPEKDADGKKIEFPDAPNFKKYQQNGGNLKRDDWRRKNVDDFVFKVSRKIKSIKPDVMFGISPFGIWKPIPAKNIKGLNAHDELYADARKWLQNGWIDYCAPQLYWETARGGLSFPVLLDWWNSQNIKNRHLWAGIATYRIGSNANFTVDEIKHQIEFARNHAPETRGTIQFSFKHLQNDSEISKILSGQMFSRNALIPASNWIKTPKPLAPKTKIVKNADKINVSWQERGARQAFWFVVYVKDANGWNHSVLPANQKSVTFSANRQIKQIIVTSVNRLGSESLGR